MNKFTSKVGKKMENKTNEYSRRSRKENNKKKKSRGRGCLWIFLILLLIGGGLVLYAYFELRSTTDTIHDDVTEDTIVHTSREKEKVELNRETPFSILLLGIDSGDMGRIERGRSDTIMVMTVNPNTEKTTLVSIPRDTYTEIVGRGFQDKINHAYSFGGPAMSMNSVQNFLDIPIDYYVSVNMKGIQQIVDAVGGITLTPTLSFNQSGFSFVKDQPTQMDGEMALAYSRMRKIDSDYGRQGRQREVVLETLSKVASFNSVLNYQSVLQTMEDNVLTNLAFDELVNIFLNYRTALTNIEQIQLEGSGQRMGGIYYEIIPEEQVQEVSSQLKTQLEID